MFRSLHVVIMQRRSLRRRLGQLEEQQDVESLLGRTAASPNVTRRGAGWFPTAPADSDLGHGSSESAWARQAGSAWKRPFPSRGLRSFRPRSNFQPSFAIDAGHR